MTPIPAVFEPILKERPWGGDRLATLLGKREPAPAEGEPRRIGESWELVSLPGEESHVSGGTLQGRTISSLVARWGTKLIGSAALTDSGRFPLLIKFLDARENLSVQVHPKPRAAAPPQDIKHEAWFVIAADPGAKVYIGEKPGTTIDHFRAAAGTAAVVPLLKAWPARPGRCYYLPSGTPHALGAGVLVAEVQTPSDTTYRLYDWDRLGLDGKPRELHVTQALENLLLGVPESEILQPRRHVGSALTTVSHLCQCERFLIDRIRIVEGASRPLPHLEMAIWIVLEGSGTFRRGSIDCAFRRGDVVLVPADSAQTEFTPIRDCDVLEVMIPNHGNA